MTLTHSPGDPNWIELYTTDTDRARDFYGDLFGWTAQDSGPEYGGYIIFERDGAPIAGCMKNDGSGGPSAWTVYLASEDAAKTAELAKEHGGQVVLDPMQVGDMGHMCLVIDPAGAAVGIWQPLQHKGISARGEVGAPSWFETLSKDYDKAVPFYRDVFGWDLHTMSDTPEFRYTTHGLNEDAKAGIMDASRLPRRAAVALAVLHRGRGHRRHGRPGRGARARPWCSRPRTRRTGGSPCSTTRTASSSR